MQSYSSDSLISLFSESQARLGDISSTSPGSLYNQRLAIILGILTLLSAFAVFASCRVIPVIFRRLHKDPLKSRVYKAFYDGHFFTWWAFITIAILHIMTAFFHTGFPKSGDPDAPVHWWILGFAFSSLIFFSLVIFSCRLLNPFWNFFTGKSPLENKWIKWVYSHHGFWWWPWIFSFVAHIAIAYAHTGIWPK